jgi:hypothetical protein
MLLGSDGNRVSGPLRPGLVWSDGKVGGVPGTDCRSAVWAALDKGSKASAKAQFRKLHLFIDHLTSEEPLPVRLFLSRAGTQLVLLFTYL